MSNGGWGIKTEPWGLCIDCMSDITKGLIEKWMVEHEAYLQRHGVNDCFEYCKFCVDVDISYSDFSAVFYSNIYRFIEEI